MPETLGYGDIARMIQGAVERIRANHERLSQLDSALGDGDHGSAMLRAVEAAEKAVQEAQGTDAPALLQAVAWGIMGAAGGAPGPLLGSFFLGLGEAAGEDGQRDGTRVADMFAAGLAGVQKQTKAQVGDKTMIDALVPAVAAIRSAAEADEPIGAALRQAAEAAAAGAESTREMLSKFGKARHMGERTRGHVDPGATSVQLIFEGFADALAGEEKP